MRTPIRSHCKENKVLQPLDEHSFQTWLIVYKAHAYRLFQQHFWVTYCRRCFWQLEMIDVIFILCDNGINGISDDQIADYMTVCFQLSLLLMIIFNCTTDAVHLSCFSSVFHDLLKIHMDASSGMLLLLHTNLKLWRKDKTREGSHSLKDSEFTFTSIGIANLAILPELCPSYFRENILRR